MESQYGFGLQDVKTDLKEMDTLYQRVCQVINERDENDYQKGGTSIDN